MGFPNGSHDISGHPGIHFSMSSARKKSSVWEHFTKTQQSQTKCNICGEILYCKDGNTSSTHRHLKRKHGLESGTSEGSKHRPAQQLSLTESIARKAALAHTSESYQSITQAITCMIVKDLQPLDLVNDEGFIHLLNVLEPR